MTHKKFFFLQCIYKFCNFFFNNGSIIWEWQQSKIRKNRFIEIKNDFEIILNKWNGLHVVKRQDKQAKKEQ